MHGFNSVLSAVATIGQPSAPDIPWLRITLVLILCIALAFAAVGFLRIRYGMPFLPERLANPIKAQTVSSDKEDRLAIVERLPAGQSSQFVVLGRGKQRYLLHISQQGATVIDQFAEPAEEESDQ